LRLLTYRWPRHVRITTVVVALVFAVGFVALAVVLVNQGLRCGSVKMSPGDRCSFNGSVATYSDVSSSPVPALFFVGAVIIVAWLVTHVRRERKPTSREISAFNRYVDDRRRQLRKTYDSSPEYQQRWATVDELMAQFDKKVKRERKRKGLNGSRKKK
jgi:hypothetical protein